LPVSVVSCQWILPVSNRPRARARYRSRALSVVGQKRAKSLRRDPLATDTGN